jgi:hypothetical protein
MISPATIYPGAISSGLSLISFVYLIPIAVVIYLDIRLVNWTITQGRGKAWAIVLSFIVSLGAIGWGLAEVFTDFSLAMLFMAGGGAIMFLFSLRSIATDKEDLKHGR